MNLLPIINQHILIKHIPTHTMTQRCAKHRKSYSSLKSKLNDAAVYHYPLLCNKISSGLIMYLVLSWPHSSSSLGCDQFHLARQLCQLCQVECWQELWGDSSHFSSSQLFSHCRIRGSRERGVIMQGLQSLGLELTHYPFHQTLMTTENHKLSPDSKGGGNRSHLFMGRSAMLQRAWTKRARNWDHQCNLSTTRCKYQVDKKG